MRKLVDTTQTWSIHLITHKPIQFSELARKLETLGTLTHLKRDPQRNAYTKRRDKMMQAILPIMRERPYVTEEDLIKIITKQGIRTKFGSVYKPIQMTHFIRFAHVLLAREKHHDVSEGD